MSKIILNLLIVFIIRNHSSWIYGANARENRKCQKIDFNRPTSVVWEFDVCSEPLSVLKINSYSATPIRPFRPDSEFHLSTTDVGRSCLQSTSLFSLNENSEIQSAIYLSEDTVESWIEILVFDTDSGLVDVVISVEESNHWTLFTGKVNRTIEPAVVEIRAFMSATSRLAIEYLYILNSEYSDEECVGDTEIIPTEDPTETPTEDTTESSTEGTAETPTEDTTENPTEDTTESPTEDTTETPTEETTETSTEDTTENPTEETTGSPTEDTTESPTEDTADSSTEYTTESSTEYTTEISTEETTESPTEDTTESPTEDTTESPTEYTTESPTEDTTETSTEDTTISSTEYTTESSTEDTTEISTEDITESSTEATSESPTEVTTESSTENATEIPTEDATESSTEDTTDIPTEATTERSPEDTTDIPSTEDPDVPTLRSGNDIWIILSTLFFVTTVLALIALIYFVHCYRNVISVTKLVSHNNEPMANIPRLVVTNCVNGDHVIVGIEKLKI